MWGAGRICGTFRGALAAALLALLCLAPPVAADSLVVQPDGKLVLLGRTNPQFGALVRLQPDGSLDQSFGQGGFVVDQRAPAFAALALQADGRIVAGAGESVLARYLPDGVPDPSFSDEGISDPGTSYDYDFTFSGEPRPVAVVAQPGGTIAMAETPSPVGVQPEARVGLYDAQGGLLETTGRLSWRSRTTSSVAIADLVEEAGGALVGAGWTGGRQMRPLLARFLPGSGSDFDPSFGGGVGLVRPDFGVTEGFRTKFNAIAPNGEKLVAAGQAEKTFLVARFDREGNLDPSFGEGGFATPPIAGTAEDPLPGSWESPSSWANDVGVAADGSILLGGGTSQWAKWTLSKALPYCTECPQPMLARFDSSGHLDPSFGNGGLLRLAKPDGAVFKGEIEQVTALPSGKILINGAIDPVSYATRGAPFVARLERDGSYDSSFGTAGLVTPEFPCTVESREQQEQAACVASATMTLRLRGLRRGFPTISMRLAAYPSWAGIESIFLELPRGVKPTKNLKSRSRLVADGRSRRKGVVHIVGPYERMLLFHKFGSAKELQVKVRGGSLVTVGRKRLRRRTLRLKMTVYFTHARWGISGGAQKFVLRAG